MCVRVYVSDREGKREKEKDRMKNLLGRGRLTLARRDNFDYAAVLILWDLAERVDPS